MKRRYRVREDRRFREIRQRGRSYAADALVLCALANDLDYSRFGFAVNSRIGNAVVRNRIKRRLREAMRLRMGSIAPGWDVVLVARRPIRGLSYAQMDGVCARLLRKAKLLAEDTGQPSPASGVAPESSTPASSTPVSSTQVGSTPASSTPDTVNEHA